MLNFEINPAAWTGKTVVAMLFAALLFIVVPAVLSVIQYRMTQRQKKYALYLMGGVFASAILFGIYSLIVGLLLLVVYWVAATRVKTQAE